jgi:hypothetical protein
MSSWLPVACTGFFAILAIAERFYARFVPNISDQKHHLRIAAQVAFYSLSLSSAGLGFWDAAHESGPVTSRFVLSVGSLFFLLTLIIINGVVSITYKTFRYVDCFGRSMSICEQHLDLQERHLNLTQEEAEILDVLASKIEVSDEVKKKIRGIFEQIDGKSGLTSCSHLTIPK